MRIVVASGKGGTGKTTISASLAMSFSHAGKKTILADCDVEEPNASLFIPWDGTPVTTEATVLIPKVDMKKCTLCGICAKVCNFSAITRLTHDVLVFEHLCHSCSACVRFCPEKAISEIPRPIGIIRSGPAACGTLISGELNVGEAMSPPLIRKVKQLAHGETVIIDAPPGTACPAVEAVRGADHAFLVAEPTPFGLHDLRAAIDMIHHVDMPFSIIINRSGKGDELIDDFARSINAEVTARIPDNRKAAEAYARGILPAAESPAMAKTFDSLRQWCDSSIKSDKAG